MELFHLLARIIAEVIANCDNLGGLKFFPRPPSAFTEQGALMLASVLNSSTAIRASIGVVRAFVRLRRILAADKDLTAKLEALERKYDAQFKEVFDALRGLMAPPKDPPRRIGFKPG